MRNSSRNPPRQEYSWWEHSKHRPESYSQHCLWLRHVRVYCQPSRRTFAHFLLCRTKVLFLPFCCSGARTLRPLSWAPTASPTGFLSSFWRKGCLMMRRLLCCWTELQRVKNNERYSFIRDKAPAVTVSLGMSCVVCRHGSVWCYKGKAGPGDSQ